VKFFAFSPIRDFLASSAISKERALLHAKLIFEEAQETIEAMRCRLWAGTLNEFNVSVEEDMAFNIVEVADGLADLIYVINSAALELGIDLEPVLDEVHRSNMSKAWTPKEWGAAFISGRVEREGLTATFTDDLIQTVCVNRADGKIIKSPSFSRANIAAVLEKQTPK
jgi:NTP pyrophosphatase (non-canonical NTP hydrolase)